jgi:ribosome-binding factor A
MAGHRAERISEQIRLEISVMFSRELSDPRLIGISVTQVQVTGDLRLAKIYVAPRDTKAETAAMMDALHHATGYFRRQIATAIDMRFAPEIRFYTDKAVIPGERLMQVLDQVQKEERAAEMPPPRDQEKEE